MEPTDPQHERLRRQIETLLRYPKVGPLGADAIARNLAVEEDRVQQALDSLTSEGRVARIGDGRFVAGPEAAEREGQRERPR